ncbi:hypothetical protein [Clostridium perfringens]|uniref:hypothetical protein n=1 Tax=Clostridium perfringens TaxID=1502 RepID=UPI0018E48405|nr:hypothetical protein [Clostridium perfringens]MBI6015603.1 hypothetical protein [Clostridium perfringens]
MILKDMELKEIIEGLTYYEGKYSSLVRASDDKRSIIIKNISRDEFLEIKRLNLDIINQIKKGKKKYTDLDPNTYRSVVIINDYIKKAKNKNSTKSDILIK